MAPVTRHRRRLRSFHARFKCIASACSPISKIQNTNNKSKNKRMKNAHTKGRRFAPADARTPFLSHPWILPYLPARSPPVPDMTTPGFAALLRYPVPRQGAMPYNHPQVVPSQLPHRNTWRCRYTLGSICFRLRNACDLQGETSIGAERKGGGGGKGTDIRAVSVFEYTHHCYVRSLYWKRESRSVSGWNSRSQQHRGWEAYRACMLLDITWDASSLSYWTLTIPSLGSSTKLHALQSATFWTTPKSCMLRFRVARVGHWCALCF